MTPRCMVFYKRILECVHLPYNREDLRNMLRGVLVEEFWCPKIVGFLTCKEWNYSVVWSKLYHTYNIYLKNLVKFWSILKYSEVFVRLLRKIMIKQCLWHTLYAATLSLRFIFYAYYRRKMWIACQQVEKKIRVNHRI